MMIDFFKNSNPIYFYFVSIFSFVFANLFREKSVSFYYFLLVIGLVFFVLGFIKRMKNK